MVTAVASSGRIPLPIETSAKMEAQVAPGVRSGKNVGGIRAQRERGQPQWNHLE